jgi:glyoxylase-like metal-dependent hydrolase (beta-lactamase superfamily II)
MESENFAGYSIEEIQPGLFAIDDEKSDSMYLIIGTKKALLIDTCLMKPDVLPMLKTLTDKPIELALTHAHIDHMYHSEEFETVYLHKDDIAAWKRGTLKLLMLAGYAMFHMPRKKFNVARFTPITEETVFDLGGVKIRVIAAPGHTPGSCIFVDDEHKALFMGDAVGNGGASAWLWLPGCLKIGAYRDSLATLQQKLEPYETYRFLGGHRPQTLPTADAPEGYPLTMQSVRDMYTLCCKMLDRSIQPVGKQKQFFLTVWQYAYGITGMWVRKGTIK